MVSITQPQRWRQQPSGATQIDRDHPLARGLVFAVIGNMPYAQEMVSGNLSQPLGTSTAKTFSTGVGLYSPSNVGNGWYANYNQNAFRTIGNEFTIACEFAAESIGDTSHIVCAPYADGTFVSPKTSFCLRRVSTTSTMMIEVGTTSATEISASFSNAMISDGQKATYVAVRSGSTASLKRDNVLMTQASSSLTSSGNVGYSTASHVAILNRSASSIGSGTGGGVLWTYIWNRALTDQEQQDIYYNPYEILLPVDRTRFYLAWVPDEYSSEFTSEFDAVLVKEYSFEFTSEFDAVPVNSGDCTAIAPIENLFSAGTRSIPVNSGGCAAIAPKGSLVSTGSTTIPVAGIDDFSSEFSSEFLLLNEFTSEYSFEFSFQNGISVLTDRISSVVSSGTRTVPTNTGNSSIVGVRDSISSSGSRTISVRTGTSDVTGPRVTESAAGSRTIPARTGTSSLVLSAARTVAVGSRAVVPIAGNSVLSTVSDGTSITATRTLPIRSGTSSLIAQREVISAAGTRTIPVRSGPATLISPKPGIDASQLFSSTGGLVLTAPLARISSTGLRAVPTRTGSSVLSAAISIVSGTGTRLIPAISGNAVLKSSKEMQISFGPSADPRQYGISLTSTCANLMLSAIGSTLNSGRLRIYSGTEPPTATADLNGNTLLAEMEFGASAFGSPVFINSSCIITANIVAGDSSADLDGIATFFRAIKSDGSTVIWQGSAGEELILTGSGDNPYQIRQGSPVNVSSLSVGIQLF